MTRRKRPVPEHGPGSKCLSFARGNADSKPIHVYIHATHCTGTRTIIPMQISYTTFANLYVYRYIRWAHVHIYIYIYDNNAVHTNPFPIDINNPRADTSSPGPLRTQYICLQTTTDPRPSVWRCAPVACNCCSAIKTTLNHTRICGICVSGRDITRILPDRTYICATVVAANGVRESERRVLNKKKKKKKK